MGNSSAPSETPLLTLRSPLVVVAVPVLFVVFGLFLPAASALGFSPLVELSFALLFAAVAVATYLIGRRLTRSRANRTAAQVREFVGVLLCVALAAWAIIGPPLSALPSNPAIWIGEVSALVVWSFVGHFRRQTEKREFFLAAVMRAADARSAFVSETGAVLAATRDFGIEAGEATDGMKRCRRWLEFFLIWFVGLLVVSGWALHVSSFVEQAGVAISAVAVLAGLLSLGRMNEEQRFVMEGLLPSRRGASLAAVVGLPLFALCVAVSVVLASRPPLVSEATLSAIAAWIAWLLSLIPSPKPRPVAAPSQPRPVFPQRPELLHEFQKLPPSHGSELVGKILTYLGWSLLAIVAAAFIWMLISPLFRLRYRRGSFVRFLRAARRAIGGAVSRALARLQEILLSLIGLHSEELPPQVQRQHASGAQRGRSRSRRRRAGLLGALLGGPNRRFVRAFLRLAKWGEQHGVPFSRSTGPREYAEMVGVRIPQVQDAVSQIAALYERHLFSRRPLDGEQASAYFKRISEVVHSGRA